MAKKLAEEAVEVVIDSMHGDRDAVVKESADLIYHLVVLWIASGIRPEDVWRRWTGANGCWDRRESAEEGSRRQRAAQDRRARKPPRPQAAVIDPSKARRRGPGSAAARAVSGAPSSPAGLEAPTPPVLLADTLIE